MLSVSSLRIVRFLRNKARNYGEMLPHRAKDIIYLPMCMSKRALFQELQAVYGDSSAKRSTFYRVWKENCDNIHIATVRVKAI